MAVTIAAARTVLQAANGAAPPTQVSVTLTNGRTFTGTARWQEPGSLATSGSAPNLILFGVNRFAGPWTGSATSYATSGTAVAVPPYPLDASLPPGFTEPATINPTVNVPSEERHSALIVSLRDIAAIAATASNSAELLPGQTYLADTSLGLLNGQRDPAWTHGTGLE